MDITVGICTWNRAAYLDRTLASLETLRIPPSCNWEVLVVDNNSTDDTQAVIARHTGKLPLRGLFEQRQGKSHACNLLVSEAHGELIVWTDDDVLVAPDWLEQYVAVASAHPEAAFFGGAIAPAYESPPPAWVLAGLPLLEGPYALAQRGDEVRPMADAEFPYGANMAVRTAVLRKHRFDTSLGPNGQTLLRGEDIRLIEEIRQAGHRGIWVGTARVQHLVPSKRMTLRYIWDWFYAAGQTTARQREVPGVRIFGMPRWVLRQYLQHLAAWCLLWPVNRRRRLDWWRKWAFEAGMLTAARTS